MGIMDFLSLLKFYTFYSHWLFTDRVLSFVFWNCSLSYMVDSWHLLLD